MRGLWQYPRLLIAANEQGLAVRWGLKALNFKYKTNENRKHKY